MNKLSAEILQVNQYAQDLYKKSNNDTVVNFLVCLDFLIKGLLAHWQTHLSSSDSKRGVKELANIDIKIPLLIGDQYHSMAYYMITRFGNIELVRILTLIEENFQKIFFNLDQLSANFKDNLNFIYEHFYNYLP